MTPAETVEKILDDKRVIWIPIKHYSPACAVHVRKIIREAAPAAVLVEGPDDATDLIQHIVNPATRPPITVLSSYVDQRNVFGQNGILSTSESVPARYRGWWPLTPYSPEYIALLTGAEVGAELKFIDVPLKAAIPFHHVATSQPSQVVTDRLLAENAYFEALRIRQRRRSFEEFWAASFEVGGVSVPSDDFRRAALTFAWCTRNVWGDEEASFAGDGTLLREAHMRWHIDKTLKAHKGEKIAVVTGAFHTVALPWTKKKRAKAKADRYTQTLLCTHSYRALSALYGMNRLPGWGDTVWEEIEAGEEEPYNAAALRLSIEIMRAARAEGLAVSTADSVGAHKVAHNLAVLRRNREITQDDLLDAVQMSYVKGDLAREGVGITRATRAVMVGTKMGRVAPEAGQAPLLRSFYVDCKKLRLDVSGAAKNVRCDLHKQEKHRLKSAFLHQCTFLGIPLFGRLPDRNWRSESSHYMGPDLVTGAGMHLITETWAIRWTEEVDDRLVELSDRGPTVARAAEATLWERIKAVDDDASEATKLLLRCGQMMLVDLFMDALDTVDKTIVLDTSFDHLVAALTDFVVLHQYRDTVATEGHQRMVLTILTVFQRCCLRVPSIKNVADEDCESALDRLQTLVRIALSFEAVPLDRQLLVEKIREMVADPDGQPAIRGAGMGVLYAFGATREAVVVRELNSYLLGSPERVRQAGKFLEGLFAASKNVMMGSPRLIRAIDQVIRRLEWHTFKLILPDLRRAFTQFIPTEIDQISMRVSEEIGIDSRPSADAPIPDALVRLGAAADGRVAAVLAEWLA